MGDVRLLALREAALLFLEAGAFLRRAFASFEGDEERGFERRPFPAQRGHENWLDNDFDFTLVGVVRAQLRAVAFASEVNPPEEIKIPTSPSFCSNPINWRTS